MTDGLYAGEIPPDERLVHDDFGRGNHIRERGEVVSRAQRNIERREVSRRYDIAHRLILHFIRTTAAFDGEGAKGQTMDIERNRRRYCGRIDVWQRRQALEQVGREGAALSAVGIAA